MSEIVAGAPAGSPPVPEVATGSEIATGVPAAPPPAGDNDGESPPPEAKAEFDAAADKAEGIKPGTEVKKPEAAKADESPEGKKEEPPKGDEAAKAADDVLTPEQEEQLTKAFSERPEWQQALKLVAPGREKDMRAALRPILARETQLAGQVERLKPAGEVVSEMLQSVGGNEKGFNNIRNLIRSFDADPATAVPMLEMLLTDAQGRAGMVLTSPELVTESRRLDQEVADGTKTPEEIQKRKAELLELEKSRVVQRRTETQSEQQRKLAEQKALAEQGRAILSEIKTAVDAWETNVKKTDPDYPKIRTLVIDRIRILAEARTNELGRALKGAEAVEVSTEALKQIKSDISALLPKPKSRQAITGGGSSNGSRQQSTTERERYEARIAKLEGRG
jgi:hypothetical protein